eukprot:6438853-Lingulodinium_polyedra.AAC.1
MHAAGVCRSGAAQQPGSCPLLPWPRLQPASSVGGLRGRIGPPRPGGLGLAPNGAGSSSSLQRTDG